MVQYGTSTIHLVTFYFERVTVHKMIPDITILKKLEVPNFGAALAFY